MHTSFEDEDDEEVCAISVERATGAETVADGSDEQTCDEMARNRA